MKRSLPEISFCFGIDKNSINELGNENKPLKRRDISEMIQQLPDKRDLHVHAKILAMQTTT